MNRIALKSLKVSSIISRPILRNGPILISGAILAFSLLKGPSETRYVLNKYGQFVPFKFAVLIENE